MELNVASEAPSTSSHAGKVRGRIRPIHVLLYTAWILIAGYFLASGWSYYTLPLEERPFSEQYDIYKPGGSIGLDLGVLGTLCMVIGVFTYSVRKRVRRFNKVGTMRNWLAFHIFLCSLGPFLVLLHTSFKVNGLVAISFVSMVVVVLSGISGRYLYVHVPRTINGQIRNLQALQQERSALYERIERETGMSKDTLSALFPDEARREIRGFGEALQTAIRYSFDKRNRKKWILNQARQHNLPANTHKAFVRLIRDQVRIERHITLLSPFRQLFRYWITFHIPLALVMGIIVLLHIGVAIAFGYVIEF